MTQYLDKQPYVSLGASAECEIAPIKGSRFIGYAEPVTTNEAAIAFVDSLRALHPHARHWCWAYQLRDGKRQRFNDDGEPNGSAGRPILAPIVGREVYDCLIVVVRYFGGTKLGVGGLVRAYSQAANEVLASAKLVTIVPRITLQLIYDYDDTGQVASALASLQLTQDNMHYGARVEATIDVLPDAVDDTITHLTNYTGGRACVKILDA